MIEDAKTLKDLRAIDEHIAALEQRARAAERANSTRPDYDLHCQECGRAHIIDTSIPSDIWNQIAKPGDVLCTVCIDGRLAAKGLTAQAEFYYAGAALNSRLYAESHGEVQAAEREAAALRERVEKAEAEAKRIRERHDAIVFTAGKNASELQAIEDERDALRLRVAECEGALRDARDNGLVYWEPHTERGHVSKAAMLSRIEQALSSPPSPVSALIEAGRLAVRLVERTNTGDYAPDAYEEWEDLCKACAAIIAKEKTDDRN